MNEPWDKLIVALDLEDKFKIKKVIEAFSSRSVKFKFGSIAFTKFGPDFVREFISRGVDIFLDLKLYDIPNTMVKTASVITELGCWGFTVHLQAGEKALEAVKRAVADTAKKLNKPEPLILGVSVLTSSFSSQAEVDNLVKRADSLALDGVIASANEVKGIKQAFPNLKVITPGIRNPLDSVGDQKRVATAKKAIANGADYIVVGRPIIEKDDYLKAAEDVLAG